MSACGRFGNLRYGESDRFPDVAQASKPAFPAASTNPRRTPPILLALAAALAPGMSAQSSAPAPRASPSPAEFRAPPAWARPHAMWQWVGYNITKEGITKDLESMKDAGVGGAIVFQITSAGTSRFAPVANVYSPGV
ncbi:MAG: hypothetical protein LBI02_04085, partial [Opitutaceae bacterium]|nr:hypothetical protein [Opitutaceae bacterium]